MTYLGKFLVMPFALVLYGHALAAPSNVEQLERLAGQYVDDRRPGAPRANRNDYSAVSFEREIEAQRQTLK